MANKTVWEKTVSSQLSRKGMVIIAIPIVFSLALILILKVLLNEAQTLADRESKSKEIIAQANGLGGAVITAVTERYMSRFSKTPESTAKRLELSSEQVLKKYEDLKASVQPGSKQMELVERVGDQLKKGLEITENQDFRQNKATSMQSLAILVQRRKEMTAIYNNIANDTFELIEVERKAQSSRPFSQKKFRQFIDLVLLFGVTGDVLLALYLMARFSSDITDRIDVLVDNSHRLIKEEPLQAPLSGKDEISDLDHTFHEMAAKLDDARQRERAVLDRLRSIIETIPLGIMIIDDKAEIVSISPGAEKMFGQQSETVQNKPAGEFFTGKHPLSEELMQMARKSARDSQAKRQDGTSFPCEILCTDYNTASMQGRLLVITDISERHEMERLKQSFVSIVSHELRSPLTSLQVCLKMLLRNFFGPLNEEGMQNVQLAETSVKRLVSLVNEILDVERLESGNISVSPSDIPLDSVIEQAVGSVSALAESAEITIETQTTDLTLHADSNRLVQVLVNFLSNAIKFSPADSKIKITSELKDDQLEVQVVDQGRGIPAEQRELVFKRFHQVTAADASEKGGAGLGLAICKAIIQAHGGTIGVNSEDGAGSTFWFRLPVAPVKAPQPHPVTRNAV